MTYKPEQYTSVSPYLIVDGAEQTMQFLETVFDAQRLRFHPGQAGKVGHGEVRIDDTVIMLCDAVDGFPAVAAHVHVYVQDVDATYARAIAAGAEPIQAPAQHDDADKRGGFRDAGGTTWWVATQIG